MTCGCRKNDTFCSSHTFWMAVHQITPFRTLSTSKPNVVQYPCKESRAGMCHEWAEGAVTVTVCVPVWYDVWEQRRQQGISSAELAIRAEQGFVAFVCQQCRPDSHRTCHAEAWTPASSNGHNLHQLLNACLTQTAKPMSLTLRASHVGNRCPAVRAL